MADVEHSFSFAALLATFVAGCVSIDSRIDAQSIDREATAIIAAQFSNRASYWSYDKNIVIKNSLAQLLNIWAPGADTVFVSLRQGDLTFNFLNDEKSIASKTFTKQALSVASDGSIELSPERAFGGDAGVIGYQTSSMRLFVNGEGNLVVIHSGGGAGTLAIVVPIGGYAKHMAVFPRRN